jgi:serine/threonine protein phosphatase PrpC
MTLEATSARVVLEAFGLTSIGPARQTNEDCFVSVEELGLFAVADGMGGSAAGEDVAQLAIESIENFIRRSHETSDFSWPYGVEATLSVDANRLRTAVCLANRRIHRLSERYDDYLGMGTTVVCGLLSGRQLVVANVGDSRLYLFDGVNLTQLTRDDSWVATVLGGEANGRPLPLSRHVLTNVLGARPDVEVHVFERQLVGGEMLLLCTDGLHGSVPDEALQRVLKAHQHLPELVQSLICTALDHGSRDNITALVVRCAGN